MCPSGKSSVFVYFHNTSSRYTCGDGEMAIISYWQQMLTRVASEELRGEKKKINSAIWTCSIDKCWESFMTETWKKWCKCASTVVSYTYTYARTGRCMLMSISHLSITHSYSNKKKKKEREEEEEKGNLSFFFLGLSLSLSLFVVFLVVSEGMMTEINYWPASQLIDNDVENEKWISSLDYHCFF